MRNVMATVRLVDGTEVDSASEAWRHETECRWILSLPTLRQRRDWLYGKPDQWGKLAGGLEQKRGIKEVQRIEATMMALWKARKNNMVS